MADAGRKQYDGFAAKYDDLGDTPYMKPGAELIGTALG